MKRLLLVLSFIGASAVASEQINNYVNMLREQLKLVKSEKKSMGRKGIPIIEFSRKHIVGRFDDASLILKEIEPIINDPQLENRLNSIDEEIATDYLDSLDYYVQQVRYYIWEMQTQ